MTELREQARKQREELERRMMGESSEQDEEGEGDQDGENNRSQGRLANDDSGCSWGMGESYSGFKDAVSARSFSSAC